MKERVIAFAGGDLLAMFGMWHFLDLRAMFVDVVFKVVLTGVLGIVGGVTGLLGKDIYKWFKNRRNAKQHNTFNRTSDRVQLLDSAEERRQPESGNVPH